MRYSIPLLLALLLSCAKQSHGLGPQALGWLAPHWTSCPPEVPGSDDALCALLEVPLNWDAPNKETITIFARKFAPKGDVRGQLWAFDGGPGETGDGFTSGWFREIALSLGFELIVPTHRGTAYGTALDCPNSDALPSCVEELIETWGSGLRHFDSHMAALDVVALAKSYQPPKGRPALPFGGSYGTIWLQRVLQARPETFSAVYLDSAGTPSMNFARFGEWFEKVGNELLRRCSEEPFCSTNFSDSPQGAAARILLHAKDNSGCFDALQIKLADVQRVLSATLQTNERRALIAPFILKFDRCSQDDVVALRAALDDQPTAKPRPVSNGLLNLVTSYRELFRATSSVLDSQARAATRLFDNGAMNMHATSRRLFPADFARSLDAVDGGFTGSMHIVQGALDPLTPRALAEQIAALWKNANIDITVVSWGGHASPRYTQRIGKQSCTEMWLAAFLVDPQAPFNQACLADVALPDLGLRDVPTQTLALEFFGTTQLW